MDYIIFDLEWSRNIRHVIPKCPDEIIQIGAVKYDKNMKYKGSFNRFIKPSVYDKVDAHVAEITGITHHHLVRFGVPFVEAFREFKSFMGRDSVLLSWGPQDIQILRVNAQYYNKKTKLTFMQRFVDLQSYASRRLNRQEKQQMALTTAAELCGIPYEASALHDAHVDAEITGKVFNHIFDKKSLTASVVDASKAQKNMMAATKKIQEKIEAKYLNFLCPECGRELARKKNWYRDTRHYLSFLRCKSCKQDLFATVELYIGKDGKQHYKRRIKAVSKIKN